MRKPFVVAGMLFLLLAIPLAARSASLITNLSPGDTLAVNCPSLLSGTIGTTSATLVCATLVPTLTATLVPTGTATAVASVTTVPTSTNVPPTATTPPSQATTWHPPTDHEHGDQPPSWAETWSQQQFGHGVLFGGDEASSPTENVLKHNVFKGVLGTSPAGGAVYWRYHAGSNPLDRSAQYHSYEIYYKDAAGGISFWQGHVDTGNPAPGISRQPRRLGDPGERPIILTIDAQTYPNNPSACEQWYMFSQSWSWDLGLTICGATTIYNTNENATASDMSTWTPSPNGDMGLHRRADGFWYLGRGGGGTGITGWFCGGPKSDAIVSTGDKLCPAGTNTLPQFIAPTLAADARNDGFGNSRIQFLVEKDYPCTGCSVPN